MNPMERIARSQLKIIDFNQSRIFELDDSPFIRRKHRLSQVESMTEEQVWQNMIAQQGLSPSPFLLESDVGSF